ncbi:MAG TPA: hypothetical protein VIR82_01500 [Bradyrhizobium sp.]
MCEYRKHHGRRGESDKEARTEGRGAEAWFEEWQHRRDAFRVRVRMLL